MQSTEHIYLFYFSAQPERVLANQHFELNYAAGTFLRQDLCQAMQFPKAHAV